MVGESSVLSSWSKSESVWSCWTGGLCVQGVAVWAWAASVCTRGTCFRLSGGVRQGEEQRTGRRLPRGGIIHLSRMKAAKDSGSNRFSSQIPTLLTSSDYWHFKCKYQWELKEKIKGRHSIPQRSTNLSYCQGGNESISEVGSVVGNSSEPHLGHEKNRGKGKTK